MAENNREGLALVLIVGVVAVVSMVMMANGGATGYAVVRDEADAFDITQRLNVLDTGDDRFDERAEWNSDFRAKTAKPKPRYIIEGELFDEESDLERYERLQYQDRAFE